VNRNVWLQNDLIIFDTVQSETFDLCELMLGLEEHLEMSKNRGYITTSFHSKQRI
jgi:hypothetical protein